MFSAGGSVRLLKGLENGLVFVRRNSYPCILHCEVDHHVRGSENFMVSRPASRGHPHMQPDLAIGSELEGVRKQVPKNLLDALRVRFERRGKARVELNLKIKLLGERDWSEVRLDLVLDVLEQDLAHVYGHRPGLYLRKVKDVVDEREKIASGHVDRSGMFNLFGRE